MAFISKDRESTGEDATIPPSFMTYHDEVILCTTNSKGWVKTDFLWRILLLLLWRVHQLFIAPMPRGTCWMTSTGLNMISFMTSIWFSICVSHSSPSRNPLSGRRTPSCQLLQKRRWWPFFSGLQFRLPYFAVTFCCHISATFWCCHVCLLRLQLFVYLALALGWSREQAMRGQSWRRTGESKEEGRRRMRRWISSTFWYTIRASYFQQVVRVETEHQVALLAPKESQAFKNSMNGVGKMTYRQVMIKRCLKLTCFTLAGTHSPRSSSPPVDKHQCLGRLWRRRWRISWKGRTSSSSPMGPPARARLTPSR